jgi:nitroreductase
MDALDAIERRTSVRRFRPDPIPRKTIERLLDAAVRAPNHKLTQPWRFAVLTGDAIGRFAVLRARHRVKRYADPDSDEARAAAEKIRQETAETPAIVIVMCTVSDDEIRREEDYAATMMAIANLMIAAEALGLGTYLRTGGIMSDPGVMSLAEADHGTRIVGVVMLGIPLEAQAPRPRRPAGELTRWITH